MSGDAGAQYDHAADAYRRSRPGYPEQAIATLIDELGIPPGGSVVELGAGSGAFTGQLATLGFEVVAVEPSAGMRAKIVETDSVRSHAGTAEQTGLPSGCADAVVAATAWHWFDGPRALREVRRLLRPGAGGLGLVWNLYDETIPWVAEFADITYRRRPESSPSARDGTWRATFENLAGWSPLGHAEFANPQQTSPERLVDRLMSSSVVANAPPDEQLAVRDEAGSLMRRYGLADRSALELPYVTSIYWTKPEW